MAHHFISPEILTTTDLFTVSTVLPFPKCHIVEIIQYVTFSDWLLSLSNIHLKFARVFSWHDSSFFFFFFFLVLNNIPLFGCTTVYLSIHSLKGILVTSKFWHL